METIKALIAEDEPPVARFIKRLVEEVPGFKVCAVCESGEAALDCIAAQPLDVLVSDIRMAGMDGLDLIRSARTLRPGIQSIIISGYKDFAYAKKAVQLDVVNYITKPIDRAELRQSLLDIRRMLEERYYENIQRQLDIAIHRGSDRHIAEVFPWARFRLMLGWIGDDGERTAVLNSVETPLIKLAWRNAIAVLEGVDPNGPEDEDASRRLRQAAEAMLARRGGTRTCVWVIFKAAGRTAEMRSILYGAYDTLLRMTTPGERALRDAEDFHWIEDDTPATEASADALPIFGPGYEAQIDAAVERLAQGWRASGATIHEIRAQLLAIAERAGNARQGADAPNPGIENIDDLLRIDDGFLSLERCMKSMLREGLPRAGDEETGAARASARILFDRIVGFIAKEESRFYTLQEIGEIFGKSGPHIRKIFKQYAGMSYNEYVMQHKMQAARDILRSDSNIMVKEVAEQVGLEQLYFCTVFKKFNGVTPTQYKAALRRKEGK